MPEFEEVRQPAWIDRTSACRYFGLPDDDEGWDRLNEIVDEFDIDCELGEVGDVLRLDASDLKVSQALFTKHEREVGHKPDDPEQVARARDRVMAATVEGRESRKQDRQTKLKARLAERKAKPMRRIDE